MISENLPQPSAPQVQSLDDTDGATRGRPMDDAEWRALMDFAEREARRQTADAYLAEDVAALTMKKLLAQESSIAPEARRTWVRTVIQRTIIDQHRRNHTAGGGDRLRGLPDDSEIAAKRPHSGRRWVGNSPSMENIARQREERLGEVAKRLLSGLNDRQRQLLLLASEESFTHEQIAEALGYASADVVKVTLNRLRKRLRDEFGTELEDLFREW